MSPVPTPSQTVGPFFSIGLSPLYREYAGSATAGSRVVIRGRVLDGDGAPVPDAVLEVWHWEAEPRDFPNGFARVATGDQGQFQFSTVVPAPRRDPDGRVHAPHLAVLLFMRGLLRHLVTRVYFADQAVNEHDTVLQSVPPQRRKTLIASSTKKPDELVWDIHLQGPSETVFFDA